VACYKKHKNSAACQEDNEDSKERNPSKRFKSSMIFIDDEEDIIVPKENLEKLRK